MIASPWSGLGAAKQMPKPPKSVAPVQKMQIRERVIKYLIEHGPASSYELRHSLGLTKGQVASAVQCSKHIHPSGKVTVQRKVSRILAFVSLLNKDAVMHKGSCGEKVHRCLRLSGELPMQVIHAKVGGNQKTASNAIYNNPSIFRVTRKPGAEEIEDVEYAVYEYRKSD